MSLEKKINIYKTCTTSDVQDSISLSEWINQIKGCELSRMITIAREYKKGDLVYERTKETMPCVTYNFNFRDKKNNDNIICPTGYLYIDIDEIEFDINKLDKNKIFLLYKSFGGAGYCLIVKVKDLSLSNFKSTYYHICEDLGLKGYIDKNAIKATQFSILSYDENIYINDNSTIYNSIEVDITLLPDVLTVKEYTPDGGVFTGLRFDNLNEIEITGEYEVNWDGWYYVKAFIPFKKRSSGNRYRFFLGYATNLVWLNPNAPDEVIFNALKGVNRKFCNPQIATIQLDKILNTLLKQKEAGTLEPKLFFKTRKIVFTSNLSKDKRREIVNKELSKRHNQNSTQKLNGIIESWDFDKYGKISQAKIYKNFPIAKKTVEKYWAEFKEFVADLNKEYLNSKITAFQSNVSVESIIEHENEFSIIEHVSDNSNHALVRCDGEEIIITLYKDLKSAIGEINLEDVRTIMHQATVTSQNAISLKLRGKDLEFGRFFSDEKKILMFYNAA